MTMNEDCISKYVSNILPHFFLYPIEFIDRKKCIFSINQNNQICISFRITEVVFGSITFF